MRPISLVRFTETEKDAIHAWARSLPWWAFILIHRWLPHFAE